METLLVLGQAYPIADTLTTLYTVPALTTAAPSSIVVCSQSGFADQFSVSVAVGGATDAPEQYLYYQLAIDASDTFIATIGITLASGDVVRCWSQNGYCSFNLFGLQVT